MTKCECEHKRHEDRPCPNPAVFKVKTIYGTFQMCHLCLMETPEEYIVDWFRLEDVN
jgi:hypothetical protein